MYGWGYKKLKFQALVCMFNQYKILIWKNKLIEK